MMKMHKRHTNSTATHRGAQQTQTYTVRALSPAPTPTQVLLFIAVIVGLCIALAWIFGAIER
jgi:hypothetical protein